MANWTIYGANGAAKAVVKELELHDEWMAECFLTITVKSDAPIDFEVGDYIDYRDERYTINYDPTVLKKARRGSYGEGFQYDNIKFVAVQDEIVRCDFCDIVLSDNQMHYTQLPTFPFYCETVDDLLDRIQANLEELYPGGWTIISPDLDKDRQRGICVNREQDFVNAYNRYIGGGTFTYDKTGIALTADNNTCWDALKWVNEQFDLNFVVRGRVIVVGTTGAVLGTRFQYGQGKGLYEIERISDSEQKIITRLKGYGAETNLPDRYYSEMNARPCFYVSELDPAASTPQTISVLIDNNKFNNVFTNIIDEVSGSQKIALGECEMNGIEFNAGFELVNGADTTMSASSGCTTRMLIGADGSVVISGEEIPTNPQATIDALKAQMALGSKIIFNAGVNKKYVDSSHITASSTGLPDNMSVNRLMLPGFPSKSLAEWVEDHMDNEKVAAIVEEGFTFSEDVNRPYIDSPNKEIYGIRPSSIYFDGSNDNEDIHPSIEGMTWEGREVDVVVSATQIEDNGVLAEDAGESEKTFTIVIPMAGFELPDVRSDDSAIEMKSGMCGARAFKIKSVRKSENERDWVCTCYRTYDETLKLYFPYHDFNINSTQGQRDKFVLTGIELPASYIEAASEKLFFATVDALRANHAPRYTFQPRIDEIWMQRQDDIAKSSHGAIDSLHDTLKSGDLFSFADEDLGISASIIIDILTIKENGNNGIPTYEVTLREEKVVSALDKRLDKITSVVSGVGGGMSGRQYSGMIALEGSELFLSKLYDDVAQGVIGFLKGVWFGTKQWFIDASGNANLYNTTVNGLLKAWNAIINNVRSSNYNGAGMLDTGWMITNEYQGYNSKAVFDYLYIRKKAEFEELEIRKISHIGGNLCLSPSSGRIWRVDYFDANDNLLGYDEHTVPWTLGGRIMNLFTKNPTILNKFLGKKKQIQRKLTDAEILNARKVRCYFFNDDGSTQTMLNWSVGAQARCQTFNIESQVKWDGNRYTGTDVANTYWWRMVSGVGEVTINGEKHKYIDFYINIAEEERIESSGGVCSWADGKSDVPMAGDVVVQFGHRTEKNQQHVIMLETTTDDAPAIKEYKGINSWNLNGCEKTKISPTTGTVMYSTKYHIETAYDDVLIPMDRGAWTSGMTCYYYDRVSYGGSLWLCIVAEGGSTTLTPGDETAAQRQVWQKQVEKGDKGEASFKSQVFKRSATKPTKPTGGSYASPVPSGWSDGIPSGTDTIWMTTRIFSTDGNAPQQSAWTDVQLLSDTESFDVEFAKKTSDGNPPAVPNGHNQHGGDQTQVWFDPSLDTTTDFTTMIWMAERTKNEGVWGAWKITKIKGEDGGFKSRVFKRTNTDISNVRPTGGTYDNPIPTSGGWTDGIPNNSEATLWSSVCTFWVDGTNSGWSLPARETDTSDVDLEYSKSLTKPSKPTGSTPHADHSSEGWYDPALHPTADWANMIWRAERKINNGAYSSDWVISKIKGEQGDAGVNATSTALKYTGPFGAGDTVPTVATYARFTWTDSIPTQTEAKPNVYVGVWQYDASTTLDITKTAPTQVTIFAHYGATGATGRGVSNVNTYFKAATSVTKPSGSPASSGWADDGSTLITKANADAGYHLFESTCTTYTDGTYSWTTPLDDGAISDLASTSEEFALANSGTTAPITGWGASVTPTAGKWIWSRTKLTFKSGDPKYVNTQCVGYCGTNGTNGTSPYFADIDNEMDSIPCDSTGKTTVAYDVTVHVGVWHGSTAQTLSKLTTTSATGVTITANKTAKTIRFQVSSGTSIAEVNRITITIASSDSGDMTLTFTLNGVRAGKDGNPATIYTLVPSVSSVVKKKDGTYSVNNVSCTRQKNVGGTITNNTTDGTITYKLDGGTEQSYTNNTNIAVTNFTKSIQFIFKVNSVIVDTESIPMVADGTNGTNGTNGQNGTNGDNGTSIVPAPNALVINQQKTKSGAMPLSNIAEYIFPVAREGASILPITTLTITESKYCDSTVENDATYGKHIKITGIWKLQTNSDGSYKTSGGNYIRYTGTDPSKTSSGSWVWKYAPSGSVTFSASTTTSAGKTLSETISVPFACNLLGTYWVEIEDDMKTEVASKVDAKITEDGVLTTTNFDNKYENASWGVKQDITKTINELKGDGTYNRSTGFTNSRLSTAEANIATIQGDYYDSGGKIIRNYSTTTQTATAISNAVTAEKDRIDGVLSRDYSTTTQTATAISTAVASEQQRIDGVLANSYSTTSQTSTMISQEVSTQTLATNIFNIDEWEQGSVDGERGNTWGAMKVDSSAQIRTKKLFPSEDQLCVIFSSSGESVYKIAFIYFNTAHTTCSTVWSGWKNMADHGTGNHRIEVSAPSDCTYVGLLLARIDNGNVQPIDAKNSGIYFMSKQLATRSYAVLEADSAAVGVQTDIEGKLYNTGINIQGSNRTINLFGDKINFYKSWSGGAVDSNLANIKFNNQDNIYEFVGLLRASGGAEVSGGDITLSSSGDLTLYGNHTSLSSGNNLPIYAPQGVEMHNHVQFYSTAEFEGTTTFDGKVYCNNDFECKDELKITNGGTKYLRIYFDSSGNVCVTGTFEHPSARYKLVVDSNGYLKLTN